MSIPPITTTTPNHAMIHKVRRSLQEAGKKKGKKTETKKGRGTGTETETEIKTEKRVGTEIETKKGVGTGIGIGIESVIAIAPDIEKGVREGSGAEAWKMMIIAIVAEIMTDGGIMMKTERTDTNVVLDLILGPDLIINQVHALVQGQDHDHVLVLRVKG